MQTSHRVKQLSYSFTVSLRHEANKRKARGEDIIDLGLGDIQFGQPPKFTEALIKAAQKGVNEYTYAGGTEELRVAISKANNECFDKVYKDKMIQPAYTADEIVHATSSKLLIYAASLSVTKPGDDIIILAPFWPCYIDILKLGNINPIIAKTEFKDNFSPKSKILENVLTPKTKAIIINSPNNPTGRVLKKPELEIIANFAERHDLLIISDEVYDTIVFEGNIHYSIASLDPKIAQRTIVVKGLSKGFGMGGMRFGYAMSKNKDLVDAVTKVISNTITSPPSLLQEAGPALFLESIDHIVKIKDGFEKRAKFTMDYFDKIGLKYIKVQGATYIFPKVSPYYHKGIINSFEFMSRLVEETGLVVLQGSLCGNDNHIRIALIQEIPVLEQAWHKLSKFLEKYEE